MKKKKGFTLVELLVVIAILAILATITVVGYISFTNKAKESNDISLTTQMNTVLQAEEATEGKADTLSTAIEWLKEAGLDVEKLTPTSDGYKYIWDKETNRFYLLNDKGEVVSPEDGEITNGVEIVHNNEQLESSNYGVYLASDYSSESNEIELSKAKSIEIGTNNINSLSIVDNESNSNIYVSGNLDNLDLNVPNASVGLYGDITFATASVASNSLHVYGHVQELTMNQGRVVAETNSVINTISAGESATNVVVESNSSSATIGAIYDPNDKIENKVSNIAEVKEKVDGFAGGVGTEFSPYLISNSEEFANINSLSEKMKTTEMYFLMIDDVVITDSERISLSIGDEATIEYFNGVLDGNDHKLTISTHHENISAITWFSLVYYAIANTNETTTFKNINLYFTEMEAAYVNFVANAEKGTILFENINNTLGNNHGMLVGYAKTNVVIKNCNNYANINIAGVSAVWIGAIYQNPKIIFENVNNYGNISGTSIGYFNGNSSYVKDVSLRSNVKITNCHNYGVIFKFNSSEFNVLGHELSGDNKEYGLEL